MATGRRAKAAMRSAARSAWARPSSARWRPAAWPGSTLPVVGVLPWRTSRTTVTWRRRVAASRRVPGAATGGPRRRGTGRHAGEGGAPGWGHPRHRRLARWRRLEPDRASLGHLEAEIEACRRCPRLVAWREQVASAAAGRLRRGDLLGPPRRRASATPAARLVVVGLAPAAHGGNRTGRMFTGDRSGDWLYGALYRAGYANQPTSTARDDGLALTGAWVTAAVRCAPPANKPTPAERDACAGYLERELAAADRLPGRSWRSGSSPPRRTRRGTSTCGPGRGSRTWPSTRSATATLLCSYHPSQRNTFTGTLTSPDVRRGVRARPGARRRELGRSAEGACDRDPAGHRHGRGRPAAAG